MKDNYVAPMLLSGLNPGDDEEDIRPSMAGQDITPGAGNPNPLEEPTDDNP